jgi:hypothetical protein
MQAYLLLLFLSLVCANAIRYKTVVTETITFDENYTITETSETITLEEPERRVPILLG